MRELREYQSRALDRCRVAFGQGARGVCLVSPTGSGKSTMGSAAAAGAVARGAKVLWLAHRKELIRQAYDTLTSLGLHAGMILPGELESPYAPVQVASVQTLIAKGVAPRADLVIPDEAHHYASDRWGELMALYSGAKVLGLTATPERGDGRPLGDMFQAMVVAASVRELQALGHLVPCEVIRPPKLLDKGIAISPLDAYKAHGVGRPTVLFASSVEAARRYLDEFALAGIPAGLVHGSLDSVERSSILSDYERGRIKVIINVYVLTEGWDHPPTSCAILARGAGTAGLYLQMAGRILRPAPGKADAVLVDLRGISHLHGEPDDEREYSLEGKPIKVLDAARLCPVCKVPLEELPCTQCGFEGTTREVAGVPQVLGIALEKYADKRRETDKERADTLRGWLAIAASRKKEDGTPWSPGWAYKKFSIVYGEWPSRAIKELAGRCT